MHTLKRILISRISIAERTSMQRVVPYSTSTAQKQSYTMKTLTQLSTHTMTAASINMIQMWNRALF